jgi:glycerophosphoryl diester phosphodiesterase
MVAPAPAHVSVTPDVPTGAKLPAPAPRRVAHGGGGALAPENTLAAFRSGLAHGADGLELDVHLSLDGRLVVIHDPTVDRTTNGSGTVADLSVAQLKALDAGARFEGPSAGPQEIPALLEVLDLLSAPGNERVGLQVEIKLRAGFARESARTVCQVAPVYNFHLFLPICKQKTGSIHSYFRLFSCKVFHLCLSCD